MSWSKQPPLWIEYSFHSSAVEKRSQLPFVPFPSSSRHTELVNFWTTIKHTPVLSWPISLQSSIGFRGYFALEWVPHSIFSPNNWLYPLYYCTGMSFSPVQPAQLSWRKWFTINTTLTLPSKKKKKSFFATPFSQEKTLTCLIWTVTFTLSSSWVQCRLVDIIVHTKYEQYQQEAQLLYQTWCSTHSLTLATRLFFFRLSTTLLSDSLFATKVIYLHILSWCLTLWIQSAAGLTKPFSEQKTALTLAGSWKRSTNSL